MGFMGREANAQFGDYGVKAGIGMATMNDDLSTSAPVLSASLGGFINYTFAKSESVLEETFFLQTGLNLTRKGSNFQEHLENGASLMFREGYYHAYYLQLPLLACVHYELPIRARGHVVGLFAGPAVSFGLSGRFRDRKITPGVTSTAENYDITDTEVFKSNRMNRWDVSAIVGVSYEYKWINASFYIDHGFLATSEGVDILRVIEAGGSANPNKFKIPNGNNVAYMFSLSYSLGSFNKQ